LGVLSVRGCDLDADGRGDADLCVRGGVTRRDPVASFGRAVLSREDRPVAERDLAAWVVLGPAGRARNAESAALADASGGDIAAPCVPSKSAFGAVSARGAASMLGELALSRGDLARCVMATRSATEDTVGACQACKRF
jgi:hypothetical protein